jgi:hypothetical protein
MFYSDHRDSYAELTNHKQLLQTKAETWGVENNNGRQRHRIGRFRRKTCIVSHSAEMVGLTMSLFAFFHVIVRPVATGKRMRAVFISIHALNGAWIEIKLMGSRKKFSECRTTHDERIKHENPTLITTAPIQTSRYA